MTGSCGPAVAAAMLAAVLASPVRADPKAAAIEVGRAVLGRMVSEKRTPGAAAAVAVDGRVVWTEGAGFAHLEHDVPATAETRFGIGSISKSLTMTAAVKLAERGVIDLDAPIERYLPDFPHRGRGVTIRRIGAHQSGLSDRFAADHYETTRHFPDVPSAYEAMREAPLLFTPGTRTEYATGLFTIVARALERAGGRPYVDLMEELVFAPASLEIVPNDRRRLVPRRTAFYANRPGGGFENGAFTDPSHKLPGAGFLARARDLAAFGAALLDPAYLGERARREMFTAVPLADGTPTPYALGFTVEADDRGPVLRQPGGGIGISAWLAIHPAERLVVALLGNVDTAPVGGPAYRAILEAFRGARTTGAQPETIPGRRARSR